MGGGPLFAWSAENLSSDELLMSDHLPSSTGSVHSLETLDTLKFSTTPLLQIALAQGAISIQQPAIATADPWLSQVLQLQHQLNVILLLYNQLQSNCELLRVRARVAELELPCSVGQMGTMSSGGGGGSGTGSGLTGSGGSSGNLLIGTGSLSASKNTFRADQQLEELRNHQTEFSAEKQRWAVQLAEQLAELTERKQQLHKQQQQMQLDREDLAEQREQLYRKLEVLQQQMGICLVNNGHNNYQLTSCSKWLPTGATVGSSASSASPVTGGQSSASSALTSPATPSSVVSDQAQLLLRLSNSSVSSTTPGRPHPPIKPCKSSPNFAQPTLSAAVARVRGSSSIANRWPPPLPPPPPPRGSQHNRCGSSPAEVSRRSVAETANMSGLTTALNRHSAPVALTNPTLPEPSAPNVLTDGSSDPKTSPTAFPNQQQVANNSKDELNDKEIFC